MYAVGSDRKLKELEEVAGAGTRVSLEFDAGLILTHIALPAGELMHRGGQPAPTYASLPNTRRRSVGEEWEGVFVCRRARNCGPDCLLACMHACMQGSSTTSSFVA